MSNPSKHREAGEIVLVVGSYETGNNETKKRYRKIGVLMESEEDDGTVRFWGKLNAEVLQPALFSLVARATTKKGDDQVNFNVFEPRDPNAPAKPPREPFAGDDAPIC